MTPREKLAKRIKDELRIDIDPATWRTTHAGWRLRSAGACSSSVRRKTGLGDILFFDPVKEYLRKDIFLDIMPEGIDLHIYAEKKK